MRIRCHTEHKLQHSNKNNPSLSPNPNLAHNLHNRRPKILIHNVPKPKILNLHPQLQQRRSPNGLDHPNLQHQLRKLNSPSRKNLPNLQRTILNLLHLLPRLLSPQPSLRDRLHLFLPIPRLPKLNPLHKLHQQLQYMYQRYIVYHVCEQFLSV